MSLNNWTLEESSTCALCWCGAAEAEIEADQVQHDLLLTLLLFSACQLFIHYTWLWSYPPEVAGLMGCYAEPRRIRKHRNKRWEREVKNRRYLCLSQVLSVRNCWRGRQNHFGFACLSAWQCRGKGRHTAQRLQRSDSSLSRQQANTRSPTPQKQKISQNSRMDHLI